MCPHIHLAGHRHHFRALRDASDIAGWRRQLAGTREDDQLDRLLVPDAGDRLLHLDLHWLNVLQGPAGWVAIDPKPVVGDPHADVFGFFDGPPIEAIPPTRAAAREHLRRLSETYAGAAGLDHDRVTAWVRIRALVYAGELAEDHDPETIERREQLLRLVDAVQ